MKAEVNQEGCVSCGYCVNICPEVFKFNNDNKSMVVVDKIPDKAVETAVEAAEGCPVGVIELKE